MLTLVKPQYITDEYGQKISVILPVDEYERIIQELEDADDVKFFDEVKKVKEPSIPFDDFLKQRKTK